MSVRQLAPISLFLVAILLPQSGRFTLDLPSRNGSIQPVQFAADGFHTRFDNRTLSASESPTRSTTDPVETTIEEASVPPVWELLPDSPNLRGARFDDIFFVNDSTGFLISIRGYIWKTTNGGDSWTVMLNPTAGGAFRSVGFANEQHGWAGSLYDAEKVLMETLDGGVTWTNISDRISGSPQVTGICGLSVVSDKVVYGVGAFYGDPVLLKTTDSGATWKARDMSSEAATLIDVHFFDEDNGIAVGGTGTDLDGNAIVLRTRDGGTTWSEAYVAPSQPDIDGEWGWKISFPSRMIGYVSVEYLSNKTGRPARVLKTRDGGLTWQTLSITGSTNDAGLQAVGFATPDVGWAGGRGTTSMTVDGGRNWTRLEHSDESPTGQLDGRINRIRFVNDSLAFAIGSRVYRLRGSVGTPLAIDEVPPRKRTFDLKQNFPNPFSTKTTIEYSLFERADVRAEVHDATGRLINLLYDGVQGVGTYSLDWDGKTSSGESVASGVYFYLIDIGDSFEMKRLVRMK